MWPVEYSGGTAIRRTVSEERSVLICIMSESNSKMASLVKLTEAGFVVLIRIREVEVPVQLAVIEFHGHGVVCLLINSPDGASQVQT